MEQAQELQHWGIKGQKWGVRRFQNEDGSLTEEGKKRYMYAARSGKLDYKKLSDKDLDMINNRFNKENQFKRNVEDYQKSKFSNQLKNAVIDRFKNGSANKKKGESWMSDLLVKPIKKAIEDALKFDIKDDKNDGDKEKREKKKKETAKKGEEFVKQVAKEDIRQLESEDRTGNATKPYSYTYYSGPRLMSGEGTVHSGISKTSDSLSHHGIKGMRWGVRRFQNEDGTLTEAGKARIAKTSGNGYLNPSYSDVKKGKASARQAVGDKYSTEYWKLVDKGMNKDEPTEEGKRLWDKYKTEYASATLKDLKLKDSPAAVKEVKRLLAQIDPDYLYSHSNKSEGDYEKFWEYENRRREKFAQRRKELEHPNKYKVHRAAGKAVKAASTVAPIIGALT